MTPVETRTALQQLRADEATEEGRHTAVLNGQCWRLREIQRECSHPAEERQSVGWDHISETCWLCMLCGKPSEATDGG